MCTYVIRALTKTLHFQSSFIRQTMKKYIYISDEVLARLQSGKCIEGSLRLDLMTRSITFRAFNRKPRRRVKDTLVRLLEHGWLKRSPERHKLYLSIPDRLGAARVVGIIEREIKEAECAIIDNELYDNV